MITLRGLTERYGDVLAVDDLTLDAEPGGAAGAAAFLLRDAD